MFKVTHEHVQPRESTMFHAISETGMSASPFGPVIGTGPFGFLFQPDFLASLAGKAGLVHGVIFASVLISAIFATRAERRSSRI
jgi:hypothetical protein